MTNLGSVLTQIFRPSHFEASRAAKALMNHPEQAQKAISRLLGYMGNASAKGDVALPSYITCNSQRGYEAQVALMALQKRDAFDRPAAKLVVQYARSVGSDLQRQVDRARTQGGQGAYRGEVHDKSRAVELARAVQHFHPAKPE